MRDFAKKPIVALIYDFDGTLAAGNMQEYGFIQALGKTPREFWELSKQIPEGQEMSEILAYMKLMVDEAAKAGISLKRESFVNFGKGIELFKGVKEWFSLINEYGRKHGVTVEHYINSSGLTEMIEGSPIASEFKKIFACSFFYDKNDCAVWPAVAVDYTAKTQFLFKINKGILDISDSSLVNASQPDDEKPIPFSNMIYVGDGETDVPCMKIVRMFGGHAIAVYQKDKIAKMAEAHKLLRQERVNFICTTDYSEGSEIYKVVCKIIDKIKADTEYDAMESANKRDKQRL
ncbi:MAG: haloacid dehalogenase-like hydrolase [Bacteroidales bacterium]|nr:haloacid dehalogenase-like hydrolase [Bacteroidales bacterium]